MEGQREAWYTSQDGRLQRLAKDNPIMTLSGLLDSCSTSEEDILLSW